MLFSSYSSNGYALAAHNYNPRIKLGIAFAIFPLKIAKMIAERFLVVIVAASLLWSCNQNPQTASKSNATEAADTTEEYIPIDATSDTSDMHNAQNSLDIEGTYKGITPCADCEGISTEVTLKPDSTYILKTTYLGKGDGQSSEQKGSFTWIDGSTIELNDMKDAPSKYFVGENTLTQLDMNGDKITGELADHYVLKK
ncbi:hypothetical protein GCM10023231_05550 [Olivibacter ginsenosidimutans]|uniref:Copper resistance protein NlpE n=1 Tax=Olivibacter ginsenosidimutans TaxID=1176537 RepID=A0ABP9AGI3_9SPHI